MNVHEIQAEELKQRLDQGDNLFLLDVRDEYEYEMSNIGGHLIPLAELPKRFTELNARQEIVAVCKMGPRGVKAVEFLQSMGSRMSAIFAAAFTLGLIASTAKFVNIEHCFCAAEYPNIGRNRITHTARALLS